MVQSKLNPADFFIDKVLLPNIINKRLSRTHIDFSPESDVFVDSTTSSRIAIYINHRPYMESFITMDTNNYILFTLIVCLLPMIDRRRNAA